MSESLFQCPAPAALEVIPPQSCGVRIEQIVKLVFQRKQATPSFDATTILAEATWTPLLTANDSTRAVLSPYINNPVIPPGEALTEGGNDNTTIGGVSRLLGEGFQQVTFELRNAGVDVRKAIRTITSETALVPGFTNVWVYMINRFGEVIAKADGAGVDIFNFFVGGPGSEGFNRDNVQMGKFDLKPGWDEDVTVFKPSFDILALTSPSTELGYPSLSVSNENGETLSLNWSAVSGATTYVVQRATNSNFTSGLVSNNVTSPTVTLAVTGLTAGTQYYFRVKATAVGVADGQWVSLGIVTEPRLVAPTVSIASITANAATINWTNVSGEDSYLIEWSNDNFVSNNISGIGSANSTTLAISGLTASTAYNVRVTAIAPVGALNSFYGTATFTTTA